MKKLTDAPFVSSVAGENSLFGNFGNSFGQIKVEDFVKTLNFNDDLVLNQLAFYIDVNKASSRDSTRVDVGGNMNMREMWENSSVSILMDENGNYCELNPNDCRYTAEGDSLLNSDGTIVSEFAHGDFMKIIPVTYGRVQTVTVGATTVLRLWLSLVPLPGGYTIPQLVVGKFKASLVSGKMRSLPGQVPAAGPTVRGFWESAQLRSKNHGLANLDFRNYLLFHMMSKYAYRDCQNCKSSDGTLVWGVGLDGTEGLASGEAVSVNGFANQKDVITGHTLSLGDNDGNIAVTLSNGNTAHGVNVAGFENPWGQYWETMGGLCSVGTDIYCWRSNIIPASTPTAETFEKIDHTLLTRPTATAGSLGMNIISSDEGQGVYMIPKEALSGVSYGDSYTQYAQGVRWLFGNSSDAASNCGLASVASVDGWLSFYSQSSSRLAYYGDLNKVSATQFKALGA